MKFAVSHKYPKAEQSALVGFFSDVEIDKSHFDLRIYNIEPLHLYKRRTEGTPLSVIIVFERQAGTDSFKKVFFPIFSLSDLDKLILSRSQHLILKDSLTAKQKAWLEMQNNVNSVFGAHLDKDVSPSMVYENVRGYD